jgi:hypothetical protein
VFQRSSHARLFVVFGLAGRINAAKSVFESGGYQTLSGSLFPGCAIDDLGDPDTDA